MSLHRDPRSKSRTYYCAYRLPNGRRVYRSTGTESYATALEWERKVNDAYRKAKIGRLTVEYLLDAYNEFSEIVLGQQLKIETVESWTARWLSEQAKTQKAVTFQKYRKTIDSFLDSLKDRTALNINLLSDEDVIKFRDKLSSRGLMGRTINDNLTILRACILSAPTLSYTVANAVKGVKNLREKEDGEVVSRQPFTIEQARAIFYAAQGDWKGAVMVGLYTGARLRDVTNLRWENVDLQKKQIEFRQLKTGKKVTIVMHDSLHDYLLGLPAPDNAKAFLFPALAEKYTGGTSGLSAAFAKIMKRAGVIGEIVRQGKPGGHKVNSLSFHSYRHTLTSWLADAGVPVELRQKFTGHASAEQNQDYTHLSDGTMRAAINKVASI